MAQAVQGGGAEHFVVGEGLAPFAEVEIAGENGGGLFVTLGDEFVEIFILGGSQGLEGEVIDLCGAQHNR